MFNCSSVIPFFFEKVFITTCATTHCEDEKIPQTKNKTPNPILLLRPRF